MYKGSRIKYGDNKPRDRADDPLYRTKAVNWVDYVLVLLIFLALRVVMIVSGTYIVGIPVVDKYLGYIVQLILKFVEHLGRH